MIRAGVIGAGEAAARHARAYESLPHACTFAAVHDPAADDPAALERLLAEVDAVSVASTPADHFHHVALALEHGLDVLVEQPLATTVENGRMLERIALLRPLRPVLVVSHPDAFHPPLAHLHAALAETPAAAVEIRRLTHAGDVLSEAMIRDVRTLVELARSPLVRLHASGRADPDYAVATLTFESGLIGTLSCARSSAPAEACTITATGMDLDVRLDLPAAGAFADPLTAQVASFLDDVRTRAGGVAQLRNAIACIEVVASVRECIAVQAAATGTGAVPAS